MALVRRVGLGLASRGDLRDVVGFAEQARAAGCESVWLHESYFERDAVTYATAIASATPDIKVALGALSTYARPAALTAMTVSALDDLAPGRITVALGSALPLRLAQMGIDYQPDEAIAAVESQLHDLRALWRGERLPRDGMPDLEPMFPPVHHVPLWVAGYRQAFHELAGRAADGYLARPAESVPAIELAARRIGAAARSAGRSPEDVEIGGYLLALIDSSRRAALDRAKREPFVIYMLAVQSDIAMRRVGLDPELKSRVFAAWREGDYHAAAALIPDALVDAFVLCGSPDDVAARVGEYTSAGMTMPVLQPVLQTEAQVSAVLEAAAVYGTGRVTAAEVAPARAGSPTTVRDRIPLRRRLAGLVEVTRPFSLTASIVPVAAAGSLALVDDRMNWVMFVLALLAGALAQIGTNVINEVYDVRKGVDTITSPRASHALVTGRVTERAAFWLAGSAFVACASLGEAMVLQRGWPLLLIGAFGVLMGWGYTAPPLQYKYRALGLPLVFVLMGPLMTVGGYFAITGHWSWKAAVASVPIGLLVTAILHGNEWRDIGEDARAGVRTISIGVGRSAAYWIYVVLLVGAYVALALSVAFNLLPRLSLLAALSMPLLVQLLRASELGAIGQQREIAMIDKNTARLHAVFGALFVLGLAAAAV
jgi:1,4-dihydroxy-2-naphthoate octaprenyltransferase